VSLLMPIQTAPGEKNNLGFPCKRREEKVMSLLVFCQPDGSATLEPLWNPSFTCAKAKHRVAYTPTSTG
jgi:hypothetical protein